MRCAAVYVLGTYNIIEAAGGRLHSTVCVARCGLRAAFVWSSTSVWHRPQCNTGPEISPVTMGTMGDSKKRPGSPGLLSSTRRRRTNDEINTQRMLVAMAAAVIVGVASVTSSVTHTMLASDIRRIINDSSSRRLDWEDHCEDLDERDPYCFRRRYRLPQQTFEKTCRYTATPASTRPSFSRTLLDEMMSCIHQQCCT